uniref:Uncharacterized protein n=1 Tax=Heliothis virescens TaxID=7102 RepID=A0A2A4K712_HELVI
MRWIHFPDLLKANHYEMKHRFSPCVESGREELKKEREIMQLVAGLQLGEEERRELPHVMRQRHAPREAARQVVSCVR